MALLLRGLRLGLNPTAMLCEGLYESNGIAIAALKIHRFEKTRKDSMGSYCIYVTLDI